MPCILKWGHRCWQAERENSGWIECVLKEPGYPRGADVQIVHTSKEWKRRLSSTREQGLAVSSSSIPKMPERGKGEAYIEEGAEQGTHTVSQ